MSKPKLLMVATTEETFATILSGQPDFLSRDFEVTISCTKDDQYSVKRDEKNVAAIFVSMYRGISPFRDLLSILKMIFVILKVKPDVVHSYTPKAGLVAMTASWLCRVDVRIHTFTGLVFPSSKGFKRQLLLFIDRVIAFFATTVVPESEGVKTDLIEAGIVSSDVKIIGYGNIAGVDLDYFDAGNGAVLSGSSSVRSELFSNNAFVFSYVGRINRDKGISELVGAFLSLPGDAELVIVGSVDVTSPPDPMVLEAINNHPRIYCVGFRKDIRPYLAASDVMVLPSYREGFPNVVLQAMALGKPVVVTDVSGANEVVKPGHTGWVVPIRDTESLCQAMLEAMQSSRDVLNAMGMRGQSVVADRYERSWYLGRLLDFYHSLPVDFNGDDSNEAFF